MYPGFQIFHSVYVKKSIQVIHFVLNDSSLESVNGLSNFLAVWCLGFKGHPLGTGNHASETRDAQAAFPSFFLQPGIFYDAGVDVCLKWKGFDFRITLIPATFHDEGC